MRTMTSINDCAGFLEYPLFQVTQPETKEVVEKFKVNTRKDTLLVFQEDSNTPVASLAMDDIPTNTILDVMEKHQYLQLPRLSNQKIFDSLCPLESTRYLGPNTHGVGLY